MPLALAGGASTLILRGGTHVEWSPPFDDLVNSYFPILRRLGFRIDAELKRWGWYPVGEGEIVFNTVGGFAINTSWAGSNIPFSRIQRRRAWATSARCCSSAHAVALENPCDRTLAGSYPALAQCGDGLLQGPVRLLSHQSQDLLRVSFQRRNAFLRAASDQNAN